jgi:hypothetical protein
MCVIQKRCSYSVRDLPNADDIHDQTTHRTHYHTAKRGFGLGIFDLPDLANLQKKVSKVI